MTLPPQIAAVLSGESRGCIVTGDASLLLPEISTSVDSVVMDPPYPNRAGHFDDDLVAAESVCKLTFLSDSWLVFWNELSRPPVPLPLVAVHIWHRVNANGRPYEPVYNFHRNGDKRRSEVFRHCHIHGGAGPGSFEFAGHPTQKPVAVMEWLCAMVGGRNALILDPFCGVGSTLVAAKKLGMAYIGIERDVSFSATARARLAATPEPLFVEPQVSPPQPELFEEPADGAQPQAT